MEHIGTNKVKLNAFLLFRHFVLRRAAPDLYLLLPKFFSFYVRYYTLRYGLLIWSFVFFLCACRKGQQMKGRLN